MVTPDPSPFFVVFDTCTQARYYGDVHEVLALPRGAAITYEYSRRLFTPSAVRLFDELAEDPSPLPLPALLMYGQKSDFVRGSGKDPEEMLRWDDSIFVPTRSATIEAVQRSNLIDPNSDGFHFRLVMKGFIDPDEPAVEELVRALEAENSLPFGDRATQHRWVSRLPEAVAPRRPSLISDNQDRWVQVIDRLVTLPTQFHEDMFWRVQEITEANVRRGTGTKMAVPLRNRRGNNRGAIADWNRDYRLYEGRAYTLAAQTYVIEGRTPAVPGDAGISFVPHNDHAELLKFPAHPKAYRPNALAQEKFSVATDFAVRPRYAGVQIETQCESRGATPSPGSLCTLSFDLRKPLARIAFASILLLGGLALVLGGATTGASNLTKFLIGFAGIVVVAAGYFTWTGKLKFGPHGG
jgi:hypothetical protein